MHAQCSGYNSYLLVLKYSQNGGEACTVQQVSGTPGTGLHALQQLRWRSSRRALFDDLLVPSLNRAVPREEADDPAGLVAEQLHLHVWPLP